MRTSQNSRMGAKETGLVSAQDRQATKLEAAAELSIDMIFAYANGIINDRQSNTFSRAFDAAANINTVSHRVKHSRKLLED